MYVLTVSGSSRLVCLFKYVRAFLVKFMVYWLRASFSIFMSMLSILGFGWCSVKMGGLQLRRAGVLVVTRLLSLMICFLLLVASFFLSSFLLLPRGMGICSLRLYLTSFA